MEGIRSSRGPSLLQRLAPGGPPFPSLPRWINKYATDPDHLASPRCGSFNRIANGPRSRAGPLRSGPARSVPEHQLRPQGGEPTQVHHSAAPGPGLAGRTMPAPGLSRTGHRRRLVSLAVNRLASLTTYLLLLYAVPTPPKTSMPPVCGKPSVTHKQGPCFPRPVPVIARSVGSAHGQQYRAHGRPAGILEATGACPGVPPQRSRFRTIIGYRFVGRALVFFCGPRGAA